jgi:predicted CoA-binding protein
MTSKAAMQDFLAQKTLAVVGVSRSGNKFGNMAYRELKAKGYQVIPVHPQAEVVDGDKAYPSLAAIPQKPGGVLVVVPPAQAEKVIQDAAQAGISHVWLQQGAESPAAIQYCKDNGISLVHNECIMMFAEPVGFGHNIHRWIWGLLGKLPK